MGRIWTEEQRKAMSELKKQQFVDNPQLREKAIENLEPYYWLGKNRDESTKEKIRESKIGILNDRDWKGGKTLDKSTGYIIVRERGDWNNYQYEHRKVMEKHLCRKLLTTEVVHHIDRNKTNNSLENLELMSNSDHSILHHTKEVI